MCFGGVRATNLGGMFQELLVYKANWYFVHIFADSLPLVQKNTSAGKTTDV